MKSAGYVSITGRSWVPPKPLLSVVGVPVNASVTAVISNWNEAYTLNVVQANVPYTKPSDGEYFAYTVDALKSTITLSNDKGGAASAASYIEIMATSTYVSGSKNGQVINWEFAGFTYNDFGSPSTSYWYKIY